MGLLDEILGAQGGALVKGLAQQFGVESGQAQDAVRHMLPALQRGLQQNTTKPGGLEALLGALQSGSHTRYLEDTNLQADQSAVDEGNGILGHILGSKDVSRRVAEHASKETGVGGDILKKMLPLVATIAMGALSKQTQNDAVQNAMSAQRNTGGSVATAALSGLTSLFEVDGDASAADQLLGIASKFLGR